MSSEEVAQQRRTLATLVEVKIGTREAILARLANGTDILTGMKSTVPTDRQAAYKALLEAETTNSELKTVGDDLRRYQAMSVEIDKVYPIRRTVSCLR